MKKSRDILFIFQYDKELEQWIWNKFRNKKAIDSSKQGFELKSDCINDAIIHGYNKQA